ncbi:MAG: ABC transporter permease [Prevotellaceae bacterium]|jgi:ABC-type antimicrobial peptide transport system permease subunit|nr:ABC transporter permease [Prevotellaceae bacterium]
MIKHYLTVAFRNLWKYKTHNLISIAGLSVSVVCFALCMYVVRGLTGINTEYPHAKRMFSVMDDTRKQPVNMPAIGNYLAAEYPEVEKFVSMEFTRKQLFQVGEKDAEKKYMLGMMEVTPSFFDFFSVFCTDTLPQFRSKPNGIVLFESTARRLFGDNRAVGEKMAVSRNVYDETERKRIDKDFIFTVCGIVKDFPKNTYFNMQAGIQDGILLNDEMGAFNPAYHRGWWNTLTVVILHKDVSLKAFNEKLARFSPDIKEYGFKELMGNGKISLLPFTDFFHTVMGSKFYILIGIFGGIGLLVLLVSLFNYTSYIVSQILEKRHACAIRKTMNAGKWHLLLLFFTEIAITLLITVFFASMWGELLVPWVNNLFRGILVIDMSVLQKQITQYFVIGLMLSFLLCLIPANILNRTSVKNSLYGGKSKNPKSRAGNILLGFQFFICIVFVTGALFLFLQLKYISTITQSSLTKTEKENILEIDCSADLLYLHKEEMMRKFKENPYIEDMLISDFGIIGSTAAAKLSYEGKELDWKKFSFICVGSNYAEFTKSKLLEGRIPEEGNHNEILVNRKTKELLEKGNVLGETIQNDRQQYVIVGVLEDAITFNTTKEIRAMFFLPARGPEFIRIIHLKVNPTHRKEAITFIRKTIREYLPETIEYELPTFDEKVSEINLAENNLFQFIGLFAFISIAISLFGVYSSVLLATERRRKEVAIRKINGAVLGDIIRLFLRTYLYILAIAAVPAFVIVYFITGKWLETYVYHISTSWVIALLLFVALSGLLTLTIIYQLMKTARINPAEVIKIDN